MHTICYQAFLPSGPLQDAECSSGLSFSAGSLNTLSVVCGVQLASKGGQMIAVAASLRAKNYSDPELELWKR
jgi:hypothetical protein